MLYLGPPMPLIVIGVCLLVLGLPSLYIVHLLRKSLKEGADFRMFTLRDTEQWLQLDGIMSLALTAVAVGSSMIAMGFIARWLGN